MKKCDNCVHYGIAKDYENQCGQACCLAILELIFNKDLAEVCDHYEWNGEA
jgi:hypothetical protein